MTDTQIVAVVDELCRLGTVFAVARALGRSEATIAGLLDRPQAQELLDARLPDCRVVRRAWINGLTTSEIGRLFDVHKGVVLRQVRRYGYPERFSGMTPAVIEAAMPAARRAASGAGPEDVSLSDHARAIAERFGMQVVAKLVRISPGKGQYAALGAVAEAHALSRAQVTAAWHRVRA